MGSEDMTGYLEPMRPLHPEPERIRLLKHESDLSSFACVYSALSHYDDAYFTIIIFILLPDLIFF